MRVFLLASDAPSRVREAVHAVLAEVVDGLLADDHTVVLQPLLRATPSPTELADFEGARTAGVDVLAPLIVPAEPLSRQARILRIVRTNVRDHYPAVALRDEVHRRMRASHADVAFVHWSAEGLAVASRGPIPAFVYYGAPDHLATVARLASPDVFGIPHRTRLERLRLRERRRAARQYGKAHLDLVRGCAVVANLCAAHARLWADAGHPDARYIPNLYVSTERTPLPARERTSRLVGSTGDAGATGNAFGLHYLGTELVPALRRRLGAGAFEVHVYGGGQAPAPVEAALDRPEIVRRGWVDDIDGEIASSAAFLLLNNAGAYQGAYTRVLHAWSLGGCLIAHARLAEMMPEVRHGENALLGENAEEIAASIERVLADPALAHTLGVAGRETYERAFRPNVVMPLLLDGLRAAAADR